MKSLIFTGFLLFWGTLNVVWGQNNQQQISSFDPTLHPVALEVDSGIVLNTVSDFILIKSLRAQLPFVGKVSSVRRIDYPQHSLLQFQTGNTGPNGNPIYIHIPLVKTAAGGYFVSSAGGISCFGCNNNCFGNQQPTDQKPCGCCNEVSSNTSKITLKKVSTALNLSNE